MERLSIDEVIEHCNKTCDMTEKIAKARGHELQSIESKQFWEHYQVREWLKELKGYRNLQEMIGIPFEEHAALCREHIPDDAKYPSKAIVLTDESVDEWHQYKADKEQGLLLRLPCKVGSTLYQPISNRINEYKVIGLCFDITRNEWMYEIAYQIGLEWHKTTCDFDCINKTVFLTKEEAEQALAKMKGE